MAAFAKMSRRAIKRLYSSGEIQNHAPVVTKGEVIDFERVRQHHHKIRVERQADLAGVPEVMATRRSILGWAVAAAVVALAPRAAEAYDPQGSPFTSANGLLNRTPAQHAGDYYNIVDYGAVLDGANHFLNNVTSMNLASGMVSTAGWTATQWQAIYPFLSSSQNLNTTQLTWCAVTAAWNAAIASTYGGVVYVPPGNGLCQSQLPSVQENQTGVLGGVNVLGAGSNSSQLTLTTELTSTVNGACFIDSVNRGSTGLGNYGFMRGLKLAGPAFNGTAGAPVGFTTGLGWGARFELQDVVFQSWRIGYSIKGDQTTFYGVKTLQCGIGRYFDNPNPNLAGNLSFIKCLNGPCSIAATAVHHNAVMAAIGHFTCFDGTSPWSYMKETNGGAPGNNTFFTDCVWYNGQCESVGWGAFGEDITVANQATVPRYSYITGTNLIEGYQFGQMGYSVGLPSGAIPTAMFDVKAVQGKLVLRQINNTYLWTPGSLGMFNATYHVDTTIEMDWGADTANGSPFYHMQNPGTNQVNRFTTQQIQNIRFIGLNGWVGYLQNAGGMTSAERIPGAYVGGSINTHVAADINGVVADRPLGVIMHVCSDNTAIVAVEGAVNVNTSGTVTAGSLAQTAAASTVTNQATPGGVWCAGTFASAASGSPAQALIDLRKFGMF